MYAPCLIYFHHSYILFSKALKELFSEKEPSNIHSIKKKKKSIRLNTVIHLQKTKTKAKRDPFACLPWSLPPKLLVMLKPLFLR